MELGKICDDGTIDLRYCDPQQGEKVTQLVEAGFRQFVKAEQPTCEAGKIAVDSFRIEGEYLVQSWEIIDKPTM